MRKKIFSFLMIGILISNTALPVMAAEVEEPKSNVRATEEISTEQPNTKEAAVPTTNTEIIRDENLRGVIKEELGVGPDYILTEADLLRLENLWAGNRGIVSLEGLQYATNLKMIDLNSNSIEEIEILENLPHLTTVSLYGNPVAEKKVFEKYFEMPSELLVGVQYRERDFWKKGKFQMEEELGVEASDPEALKITKLDYQETTFEVLKEGPLTLKVTYGDSVKTFDVQCANSSGCIVKDANLLNEINRTLGFESTHNVTQEELLSLTTLNADSCNITDLEGLQYATNLERVDFSHNKIEEIEILENLPHLTTVSLYGNPVAEKKVFEKYFEMPAELLVGVQYSGNDFWKKGKFHMEEELGVEASVPEALKIIKRDPRQTTFEVTKEGPLTLKVTYGDSVKTFDVQCVNSSDCIIKDANLLKAINRTLGFESTHNITQEEILNLTELYASYCNITDLEGLQYATNLKTVSLADNKIADISILESMTNLETVMIDGNAKAEEQVFTKYFREEFEPLIVGTSRTFYTLEEMVKPCKYSGLMCANRTQCEIEQNGVLKKMGDAGLYAEKAGKANVTFKFGNAQKTVEIECVEAMSQIPPEEKEEKPDSVLPVYGPRDYSIFMQDQEVYFNNTKGTQKIIEGKEIVQVETLRIHIKDIYDNGQFFVLAKDSQNNIWSLKMDEDSSKGMLVQLADNAKALYSRGYMDKDGIVHSWRRTYDQIDPQIPEDEVQLSDVVKVVDYKAKEAWDIAGVYFDGGRKRLVWRFERNSVPVIEEVKEPDIFLVKQTPNMAMDQNGKMYSREKVEFGGDSEGYKWVAFRPELTVEDFDSIGYLKEGTYYSWKEEIISRDVRQLKEDWWGHASYITKDGKYYEFVDGLQWKLRCEHVKDVSFAQNYILNDQGILYQVKREGREKETSYELIPIMNSVSKIEGFVLDYGTGYGGPMYKHCQCTVLREDGSIWKLYDNNYPECIFKPEHTYKGSWIKSGSKWWFAYETGGYPYNEFKKINDQTYYFDGSGYMVTGWRWIDNHYYYFNESGYMQKGGWQWINGSCYYFYEDGHMAANEMIGDSYVNGSGAWVTDHWVYSNYAGKYWYQYAKGGYPYSELKKINGQTYYFDGSGYMVTGWRWIDNHYYYFNESGYMQKGGWQWINGSCYYFYEDGHMASNETIGDSYVNESGAWVTDYWVYSNYAGKYWYQYAKGGYPYNELKKINGQTYYFDGSGYMVTGWRWINNHYYYFNGSGYMQKGGWQWINGSCYYFYEDGHMASDESIGGSYVDSSGAWVA